MLIPGADDGSTHQHEIGRGQMIAPTEVLIGSLLQVFPFAFAVRADGTLGALGRFFQKRHRRLINSPLAAHFTSPNLPDHDDLVGYLRSKACHDHPNERIELIFIPSHSETAGDVHPSASIPPATERSRQPDQECPEKLAQDRGDNAPSPESLEDASAPALPLLGTILLIEASGDLLFLGTIAPSEAGNLVAFGLSISDFGPADPTPEFAMMAEVNAGMLADSQLMNKQLVTAHEKAVAAKRELEHHRDGLEALVRDRTAVIERQSAELQEALEQEKRLSALQRSFVSMASHEFRTPLAIIDGYAQKIERRIAKMTPDDIIERIGKIRLAVKRMTSLMESTLAAAKWEAGRIEIAPEPIDIRAMLLDCCQLQRELAAQHEIVVDHQGLPDEMIVDPTSLTQILTNLLSNAIKYSPEADKIEVRGWREAGNVLISVRDYGIGIDKEDQGQMFTRFFRAKTSVGMPGTGIGLNLAQMLAKEHGGTITLSSARGEGSVFTVKLPRKATPRAMAGEAVCLLHE